MRGHPWGDGDSRSGVRLSAWQEVAIDRRRRVGAQHMTSGARRPQVTAVEGSGTDQVLCEASALVGDSSLAVGAKGRSDRTGVGAGRGGCMMEARLHLDCMPQR